MSWYTRFALAFAVLLIPAASHANFLITVGAGPTALYSFNSGNGGTSSCATANVECMAHVVVGVDGNNVIGNVNDAATAAPGNSLIAAIRQLDTDVKAPAAISTWAAGTLGAMANYGTSPGAVLVPGVNASVTNFGTGTAGSAAGGVVTVQGVASMTPVFASNDPCSQGTKLGAVFSITGSTQIVTGTSAKKTYICAIDVVTATAQNIALVEGTGSVCATNIFGLAGGTTAATGWNFAANGGIARGAGSGTVYSPSADSNGTAANVCLLLSGSGQTSGQIAYVQQ